VTGGAAPPGETRRGGEDPHPLIVPVRLAAGSHRAPPRRTLPRPVAPAAPARTFCARLVRGALGEMVGGTSCSLIAVLALGRNRAVTPACPRCKGERARIPREATR
jgi:hypothetical protein